jgi:hypothetical protein
MGDFKDWPEELLKYWPFIRRQANRTLQRSGVLTKYQEALPYKPEDSKLLGCGFWGCVWECQHNPRFTIKLTYDPVEGPTISKLIEEPYLRFHPGVTYYHDVWAIPLLEGTTQHVLPKKFMDIERSDDIIGYLVIKENAASIEPIAEIKSEIKRDFRELSSTAKILLRAKKSGSPKRIEKARREWLQVVELLKSLVGCQALAEFLVQMEEAGVLLRDIHLDNIGESVYSFSDVSGEIPNNRNLVLIDVGHASIEMKSDVLALALRRNPIKRLF